ncbi:MAG TPA: hypothetical protein VMD30_06385 [Tepidisphaeraceae bacterium]|nr:hypothetical protein [Tepidisphaeraceae bacterium]
MKRYRRIACGVVIPWSSRAMADAGVFGGTGQNFNLISSESVQLVSIDVTYQKAVLAEVDRR